MQWISFGDKDPSRNDRLSGLMLNPLDNHELSYENATVFAGDSVSEPTISPSKNTRTRSTDKSNGTVSLIALPSPAQQ